MSTRRSYDDDLVIWLAGGERGISSNTIVEHLTGLPALKGGTRCEPADPADLRRCLLLLEAVPKLKSRFYEMQTASKHWNLLTVYWKELEELLESEVPKWRDPNTRAMAPKTYKRMEEIERAAK